MLKSWIDTLRQRFLIRNLNWLDGNNGEGNSGKQRENSKERLNTGND